MIFTSSIAVVLIYLASVAYIMLDASGGPTWSVLWLLGNLFFFALNIAPQGLFLYFVKQTTSTLAGCYYIIIQVLLSALALFAFYDAFYVNLDAQSGILFFIIPIYFSGFVFLAWLVHLGAVKIIKSN